MNYIKTMITHNTQSLILTIKRAAKGA